MLWRSQGEQLKYVKYHINLASAWRDSTTGLGLPHWLKVCGGRSRDNILYVDVEMAPSARCCNASACSPFWTRQDWTVNKTILVWAVFRFKGLYTRYPVFWELSQIVQSMAKMFNMIQPRIYHENWTLDRKWCPFSPRKFAQRCIFRKKSSFFLIPVFKIIRMILTLPCFWACALATCTAHASQHPHMNEDKTIPRLFLTFQRILDWMNQILIIKESICGVCNAHKILFTAPFAMILCGKNAFWLSVCHVYRCTASDRYLSWSVQGIISDLAVGYFYNTMSHHRFLCSYRN